MPTRDPVSSAERQYYIDTGQKPRTRRPVLDAFTRGYVECALWTSDRNPGSGEWSEHDTWCVDRIPARVLRAIVAECAHFQRENADLLEATDADPARNGHDLWLTRNRHGAGYWDRGYGDIGRQLTDHAHTLGEAYVYSARGWIYVE